MSLLKLSPEAIRLRRIAKACAAGELSRLEYREARRAMIDKFVASRLRNAEDTQPRFDLDITQRRPVMAGGDEEPVVGTRAWMFWLLAALIAVAVALLPLSSFAATIPAVAERDPNPATAPHFTVDRLAVTGVEEHLDVSSVQAFVADALARVKAVNAPAQHGFNAQELEEVARYLNAIGLHDEGTRMSVQDLEDLQALVAAQKARRGVSLVQLETVARELQAWIRDRGYPLARAYLPAQEVEGGEVQLAVALGRISAIAVSGTESLGIDQRFADLLGEVASRDAVETKLNTLNRTRGLRAEAAFKPGVEVGTTEMVLDLKQHQEFTGFVQLDNYGVEAVGDERLLAGGQWNSPRGVGDVLRVAAFSSVDPADHQFFELGYLTPILSGRFEADTTVRFADLALDELGVEGDGVLFDASLRDTRTFTRGARREYVYGVGVHDLDWDFVDAQRAWFAHTGVTGHRLWDDQRLAVEGELQGLIGGVDEERLGQESSFWRLRAAVDAWRPLDLFGTRARMTLGARWQVAEDALPPTLRLAGSGPFANKGFEHGQVLLDQGVTVNSTLRFAAPRGDWWIFVDGTYGERNDLDAWVQLTSVGLGWEAELLDEHGFRLHSRVTVGYPVAHESSGGIEDDGTQIYWSLRLVR